jgi:hypothetical protein
MSASLATADRRKPAAPLGRSVQRLGAYTDGRGRARELLSIPAAHASMLVVDRVASSGADPRLVAHLDEDEPGENAGIVAALYLADARGRHCRPLRGEDFADPALSEGDGEPEALTRASMVLPEQLCAGDGSTYRLELVANGSAIPEVRWRQQDRNGVVTTVTVRRAMASLESYEPVRGLSEQVIEKHRHDPFVSVAALHSELERVRDSPIVLNRGLREAVLKATKGGVTMSEIAMRCGRIKRDANGSESGETSWLARRIGTLPESGHRATTPWVHTDVLALIARDGLRVAPREAELG